jgi:hypothetical protein
VLAGGGRGETKSKKRQGVTTTITTGTRGCIPGLGLLLVVTCTLAKIHLENYESPHQIKLCLTESSSNFHFLASSAARF